MKKITLLLVSLLIIGFSYSQSISNAVIALTGNYSENNGYSLSSTAGEPVTTTLVQNENILTQGFQQSDLETPKIKLTYQDEDKTIYLYPNPVVDNLNIVITGQYEANYNFEVFDVLGRKVETTSRINKTMTENRFEVNMNSLTAGIYLIRIIFDNDLKVTSFKISKADHK